MVSGVVCGGEVGKDFGGGFSRDGCEGAGEGGGDESAVEVDGFHGVVGDGACPGVGACPADGSVFGEYGGGVGVCWGVDAAVEEYTYGHGVCP